MTRNHRSRQRHNHRVVIVAFDGVQSLDVAGPAEVFAGATHQLSPDSDVPNSELPGESNSNTTGYHVTIASLDGGVVATESAVRIATEPLRNVAGPIDTLLLPGGFSVRKQRENDALINAIRSLAERSQRLVTVCSGTYLAAAAGLLDGHRVTTHWARADRLAQLHPNLDVDADPIFIHSLGNGERGHADVWSSAGVTAGIDLSLALVEHDHSTELAQTVARWLVMFLRRPGGQSQFATPTWIRQAPPGPVQHAQTLVIDDPAADHRVGPLAATVGMSERHFVRRFTDEVGLSPARYVAQVRVEAARQELETSADTVAAIARRCGFGSAETMRRTLLRHLGVSPDAYRQRFTHAPVKSNTPV